MSDWIADIADTRSLGSPTREWLNLYIGDAGGIYFGLAQDIFLSRRAANKLQLAAGDHLELDEIYLDATNRDIRLYRSAANVLALPSGDNIHLLSGELRIATQAFGNIASKLGANQLTFFRRSWVYFQMGTGASWVWIGEGGTADSRMILAEAGGLRLYEDSPVPVQIFQVEADGDVLLTGHLDMGTDDILDLRDIYGNADVNICDQTLTANSQHDINFFGDGAVAQPGNFYNIINIWGGRGRTRRLQLYSMDDNYPHVVSTFRELHIEAEVGWGVTFNSQINMPAAETVDGVDVSGYQHFSLQWHGNNVAQANGLIRFVTCAGLTTVEAYGEYKIVRACYGKRVYICIGANTLDAATLVTVRKNGVDQVALRITIGAGATGWFSDTGSVSFALSDRIAIEVDTQASAAGSIWIEGVSVGFENE